MNNNEELKAILDAFLEAFSKKISHLSKYEDLLIKEADILKNMYEKMLEQSTFMADSLKQFNSEKYVFFRDFRETISNAIEDTLRNLLMDYNINFTLVDKSDTNKFNEQLEKRLKEIEIDLLTKLSPVKAVISL